MARIAFIHTAPAAIAPLNRFYAEHASDLTIYNLLDDSVLRFFREGQQEAAETALRAMLERAVFDYGAEAALVTCSSVSTGMASRLATIVKVPVLKIDTPMAEAAVQQAHRIGVLISFPPTQGPTSALLHDAAAKAGKRIELLPEVVPAAYDALNRGDMDTHNRMLQDGAQALVVRGAEVIVLAQVSMAALQPVLAVKVSAPVLSSLDTSLLAVRSVFAAA
jgi:aspartate/glutamate racemase